MIRHHKRHYYSTSSRAYVSVSLKPIVPDSDQPRLCPSFGPFMQIFNWCEEKLGHESFDAPAFIGIRDGRMAGDHWLVSVKFSEGSSCRLDDGVLLAFCGALHPLTCFGAILPGSSTTVPGHDS